MLERKAVCELEQMHLFDLTKEKYKITKPIRLIELFGGIGSQAMALERLGVDFEHYRLVEFDKYPVMSYNAIHGTNFEPTDITKIDGDFLGITDKDKYIYLLTYSFPCQDLSVAGRQKGMKKGSGTRSGLLWEVERLLNETKELPDVLLMENVPQVHSEENKSDFRKWIDFLESKGYSNYYQDLNAKDFGVAQNRDRCFMVSILGDYFYKFPETIELDKTMKNYLEDEVDEKYYINSEKAKKLIDTLIENGTLDRQTDRQLTYACLNQEKEKLQTASKQDTTQESQTYKQMEAVLLSCKGEKFEKQIDVANSLLARDYKGFGNQATNGVIEWE